MKKIIALLFVTLILLTGCAKTVEVEVPTESPVPTAEPTEEPESDSRPIAIMIDNDNDDARPHAGVEDAYMIYEMYVEGSATRMMALFKDAKTEKIGPVRSSRHYFLDYALEHNPIYVHFGWSPKAAKDISALGVNNINGVSDGGSVFWRERKHKNDWHSAYTSIENIEKFAKEKKEYDMKSDVKVFDNIDKDASLSGDALDKITMPYAPFYKVTYEYDAESDTYKRFINGKGHITQADVHLAPKNIIIHKAKNFNLAGDNSGRQDIETVGSGDGYLISGGKIADITWEKSDRKAKTVYKFSSGEEITLKPGQTWVQIVPPSMELTIEPAEVVETENAAE